MTEMDDWRKYALIRKDNSKSADVVLKSNDMELLGFFFKDLKHFL